MFKKKFAIMMLVVVAFATTFTSAVYFQQMDHTEWMPQAIAFGQVFVTRAKTMPVVEKREFYRLYCDRLWGIYSQWKRELRSNWQYYPPYTSLLQQVTELMCKHKSDLEAEEREIIQPLRDIFVY